MPDACTPTVDEARVAIRLMPLIALSIVATIVVPELSKFEISIVYPPFVASLVIELCHVAAGTEGTQLARVHV